MGAQQNEHLMKEMAKRQLHNHEKYVANASVEHTYYRKPDFFIVHVIHIPTGNCKSPHHHEGARSQTDWVAVAWVNVTASPTDRVRRQRFGAAARTPTGHRAREARSGKTFQLHPE